MSATIYVSPAQVAAALGVSVTTVKRWVDDGILPAHRTPGGHRKLLLSEVLRLVKHNHFPRQNLSLLGVAAGPAAPVDPPAMARDLYRFLHQGDGAAVRDLLLSATQGGLAVGSLADDVIRPAMTRVGEDWEAGRIDVMYEHRATQQCVAALYAMKGSLEVHADRHQPLALGGAPEHDATVLSSLLAQLVLLEGGWNAMNLGPHTPLASFRVALRELRPRLLWLSCTHPLPDVERFQTEYRALYAEAERLGVAVAVGGRSLTECVRSGLPYTMFGDGLTQLAAFAHTLHPRPQRPRRGRPPGSKP